MATKKYYLDYNVTGSERKRLVSAISTYTGVDAKYLYAPTFAYEIGAFLIDKNGVVSFDSSEAVDGLVEALVGEGFVSQVSNLGIDDSENAQQSDTTGLTVEIPLEAVQVGNLTKILEGKGSLIKKALGINDLQFEVKDDRISFPWFSEVEPDEATAYSHFISAICEMAKNQKRITAKEKETDNDKYAFRCFLLRLGFIGAEFKTERKILLRNLTGSSAFKGGAKNAVSQ